MGHESLGIKGWGKLDAKADEGRWIGYSRESQAHCIYCPGKQWVTDVSFDNTVTISNNAPAENEGEWIWNNQHCTPNPNKEQWDLPYIEEVGTSQDPPQTPFNSHNASIWRFWIWESGQSTQGNELQGRSHRLRKRLAYVCSAVQGQGTTTGWTNAPNLPHRMQVLSHESAASAALQYIDGFLGLTWILKHRAWGGVGAANGIQW